MKKGSLGYIYLLPWILGFLCFHLYPIFSSLYFSFTDLRAINVPEWKGLANYVYLFAKDDIFLQSLKVTVIYAIVAVPTKVLFALIVALLMIRETWLSSAYRTIYFIPSILGGSVVISILWRFLFMQSGLMNAILVALSLPKVDWLGPDMALFTLSLLPVWQFGSSMVIFLAGLKNIPKELHEAAFIDGASKAQVFFKVTLPLLTPIIFFNLVMQMIQALQEFTSPFVITNGGPLYATHLLGMKVWQEGFQNYKMGYACAVAWMLMLLILTMTVTMFKTSRYWVFYQNEGDQ